MTNAEAIDYIEKWKTDYSVDAKDREVLSMAIKALEQQSRDCKTCKHSENGNCAGTEECHECMRESKYEQELCEDAISREAVIKHTCESKECYKDECKGRLYKRCFDLQWIYDLPSVTPPRPRGKIIYKAPYGWGYCSECNGVVEPQDRFCSFCGTRMESDSE